MRGSMSPGDKPRNDILTSCSRMLLAAALAAVVSIPALAADPKSKNVPVTAPARTTPAKPKIIPGSDPGGVAVAIIGSGVNYTLPQIASRLARDGEGDIIGLDFIDRDNKPFDVTGREAGPDGISSYGTSLAAIVLQEAARTRLVPARVRLDDLRQIGGAASFVAATPARVAVVAFADPGLKDLEPFRRVVEAAAPQVLFVLGAGDVGVSLDEAPLHPAQKGLQNSLVVTAADEKGGLLPTANRGAAAVDIAVAAESVPSVTLDGKLATISGTRTAAARVAALAARLLAAEPGLSSAGLKGRIAGLAKPIAGETKPSTKYGFIDATGMTTAMKP